MGNKQGKWILQGQPRHPDKKCTEPPTYDSCVGKPETRDASVQAQESSAPMESMQEGPLPGDPVDAQTSQEAPPVPDPGSQFAGQVMQQHPLEFQDRASNDEMPAPVMNMGDERPPSREMEPDLQETPEGHHHLVQFPHSVEIMDNELNNARLEVQMEE